MSLAQLKTDLKKAGNPKQAKNLQWFFKTGIGEYGEGDVFLGLKSQQIKDVAGRYLDLDISSLASLLHSKIHEERVCALRILVHQYNKYKNEKFVKFYLKNYHYINNWDLVDMSAHKILGDWLLDKPRKVLYELAASSNLWKRRIAIISTFAFIAQKDFADTLKICKLLLSDKHDLIHKACGWMLREVGKKDEKVLLKFLDQNFKKMPRTMLRYSIERLDEKKRKFYLNK